MSHLRVVAFDAALGHWAWLLGNLTSVREMARDRGIVGRDIADEDVENEATVRRQIEAQLGQQVARRIEAAYQKRIGRVLHGQSPGDEPSEFSTRARVNVELELDQWGWFLGQLSTAWTLPDSVTKTTLKQ